MKSSTLTPVLAALLLVTGFTACKKSLDTAVNTGSGTSVTDTTHAATGSTPTDTTTGSTVTYPQSKLTRCPGAPDYGDSIIFIQPSSTDYIIKPINHPDTGTYYAWPDGMVLDKNTGAINVSKSESGLRYNIGYVKKGTTDTCLQTLILAGVSYEDSLYVLNDDQRYAKPYYNADPNLTNICSGSGVPGGSTCSYDINGNAKNKHIIIDHNTGIIDLKNTVSKAFGLIPINGTTVTSTIAYQLNDNSNMAVQQITVKFIFYNKRSDVPADLLAAVTDKLNKILSQVLLINLFGSSSQQNYANPRPPIIIVTRFRL